jgi:AraC-like DNA-binding protein
MSSAKAPSYLVYLWPGRGLVLSGAILATGHRHAALQLTLGLDGPFKLKLKGGDWFSTAAAILNGEAEHELDGRGHGQANFYVEPDSPLGRTLQAKYLSGKVWGQLPEAALAPLRKKLLALAKKPAPAAQAYALYGQVAEILAGVEAARSTLDERVAKALAIFTGLDDKKISASALAKQVFLSESRLSHLFQEQLGLPIRRYLLWLKVLDACSRANSDSNITEAAHAAGFTDAAHFTHTARQLLGISPGMLFQNRSFVHVVVELDRNL